MTESIELTEEEWDYLKELSEIIAKEVDRKIIGDI